jgi:hypothetical protein
MFNSMTKKPAVLWDILPFSSLQPHMCFDATYCLHLQDIRVIHAVKEASRQNICFHFQDRRIALFTLRLFLVSWGGAGLSPTWYVGH